MNVAVFAYSRQGCRTARRVMDCLAGAQFQAYTMERFAEEGFAPLGRPSRPFYGAVFAWADAMIFVGSCGIAVREIAPHVRDKRTDPAVISMDELGRFVIPLLSGHIGGANELAAKLAESLEAVPVITTATDINRKFSVDAWAARQGFAISSMRMAKRISAAILERNVYLTSDFPIGTKLPPGVTAGDHGDVGICVTCKTAEPFTETLRLIPPVLHLGIGCRRGTAKQAIRELVEQVFAEYQLDMRAVRSVESIDLKSGEAGLLEFCEENRWPVSFYSAEELQKVEGDFTPSDFVRSVTGVDNVCERSALIGAKKLMIKKTARNGVTVAVAVEDLEVRFG